MDFTQPWDFGDATFIVEDKKIYVNKAVLAMSSDVFRAIFMSDFKEKEMTEIPLPDKKFDDFLQLMEIIHPQVNVGVDGTNVAYLLPLAHEYLVDPVLEKCDKYLLTQPPSVHNLILADKFSLVEVRQTCLKYVKEIPYNKLEQDPEFKMIAKESLCEVLQQKMKVHEGKDPLKNVVCSLMAKPSVKNFLLAEKHTVPEAYKTCMKYMKDTPLRQLKAEAGYKDLKPATLNEVLTHKFEMLQTEVKHITSWGKLEEHRVCSGTLDKGHIKGRYNNCLECSKHRLGLIGNTMKKY